MIQSIPSNDENALAGDHSLLSRLQRGDDDAATAIYLRYARRLHALAAAQCSRALSARVEAGDIVQSVFRTFFRRATRGEYDVPQGEELWKLLLVIALHKIRSTAEFHYAAKRDVRRTIGGEAIRHTNAKAQDEQATQILQWVVDDMTLNLSTVHREIIRLRINGLEIGEISKRAGCSKRSVERVLQGFRETLSKEYHEES